MTLPLKIFPTSTQMFTVLWMETPSSSYNGSSCTHTLTWFSTIEPYVRFKRLTERFITKLVLLSDHQQQFCNKTVLLEENVASLVKIILLALKAGLLITFLRSNQIEYRNPLVEMYVRISVCMHDIFDDLHIYHCIFKYRSICEYSVMEFLVLLPQKASVQIQCLQWEPVLGVSS